MKRYLETPEEVINALKDGKVVYEENCPDYSFKLIENIIVAKYKDSFEVGSMVSIGNEPYVLEEEPLKIEVGKFYKTRDGRKAYVYTKIDFDYAYPFCVVRAGKLDSYNVNKDGKEAAYEQPLDLVAPWEE